MSDIKNMIKIEMVDAELDKLFNKTKEIACKINEIDMSCIKPDDLPKVFDMMKDSAETKMYLQQANYFQTVTEAMEENAEDYGETWNEDGPIKGYNGQPRSKTSGRFMSYGDGRRSSYVPEMYDRDMPTMMGYSSGNAGANSGNMSGNSAMSYNDGYSKGYEDGRMSNQSSMSRMEKARRGYDEVKHMPNSNDSDKQKKATKLHELMQSVIEYVEGIAPNMSNEEKTVLNHDLEKMRTIATK